ncbi:MAG: flotillin family protein [Gammaproteobacteria bacterium]|nr:flotillin family protein [Gammaproteobacteria bacterium]
MNLSNIAMIAGVILIALIVLGLILSRLYKRASKEVSFVRTGFGGQKVIMNGGALVFPVLHEIIPVNMNTLRLEVRRAREQALITRDRMRVDVTAEFYVRVKPSADAIADAAQTLGMKTLNPDELKNLVEGKFVDALRSVASQMAMEELHENRVGFVQKVLQGVSEDLLKNGLELESVSLTGLDQTSKEFFNPDNAFDAEGLTKLTEEIEERRKKRNEIEQNTNVAVATKNLEAERQTLEIQKETEYARLQQQREIEIRKAAQQSEIAREQAEKQREADQAQIDATRQVDLARIMAERAVEEERIEKEKTIKEKDVLKLKAIELAEQDRAIAIAEKSKEQSVAQANADKARAAAVKEEEAVRTVRETEVAERAKAVELVEARKLAEREAIKITVAADAEKQAAEDQAEAVKTIANAEAERYRIEAQGRAEAEKLQADAAEKTYAVEAAGKRAINEAQNLLSVDQIAMQVRLALLKHLPDIIRESVKPMEQIDSIKIFQVDGINGAFTGGNHAENSDGKGHNGSLADQVVNSALRYRGQAPLIDSLMKEIGLSSADINGLTGAIKGDLDIVQEKPAGRKKL